MGGNTGAVVPAKGPGDTSGESELYPPFRNWRVPGSTSGFSLPQPVPKLPESGEQPTEIFLGQHKAPLTEPLCSGEGRDMWDRCVPLEMTKGRWD